MKNIINCALFAIAAVTLFACASEEKKQENTTGDAKATSAMANFRYIDADSLAKNYNLAKDLNDAYLRSYENYQNVGRQKAAEIQKFENAIVSKQQNNQYLTQASYEADMQKYQQMSQNAQNQLARLEQNMQEEQIQNSIQLNDSIDNYLKILCKEKGYEIVLKKDAAFYVDPKYDITEEVVKGLNARYVKVKK